MLKKNTIISSAFEDYKIIKQIGQGGNGTVFLASVDDKKHAIKVIDKNKTNKIKIQRFKNEINFCQKYNHPNIIKVLDYGTHKNEKVDYLFYVMPYINTTLRNKMDIGISPENIIKLFFQILDGIDFAHNKDAWHRDLKPENILVDENTQTAIIADFGIAHFCEDDIITTIETRPGDRLANFQYAAPEQKLKGHKVDAKADIYALGLILNEMFTKSIISGSNYKKIADCSKEYDFLDDVVERLITQEPNERIFPVYNILIEMNACIKLAEDSSNLKRIEEKVIDSVIDEKLFLKLEPCIKDLEYENEQLNIYLNMKTPEEWDSILTSGKYGHSSAIHHPPQSFNSSYSFDKKGTKYTVTVKYRDKHYIENIVEYFKTWIPQVMHLYNQKIKHDKLEEIRIAIERREEELKKKQAEMKIRENLRKLI